MGRIFRWFYCLPIPDAVLLIVLATALFLLLRRKWGNRPYWKAGICVLLIGWTAVILWATLGQRSAGGTASEPILMPFYSYYMACNGGPRELYRTNFMNVLLFYPAGLMGCGLFPQRWSRRRKILLLTCFFTILSICIEYAQYRFGLGLAETDDIIHNAVGIVLGAAVFSIPVGSRGA